MYKLFMIAKNNMKKQKGDMITLFILTLLSAFLIFSSVSVLTGMGKVMDDAFEKNNGAEVMLYTDKNEGACAAAEEAFKNENPVDYESVNVIDCLPDYRNAASEEWSNNEFFFGRYEHEQRLQKMTFPEGLSGDDIIVPYQMKNRLAVGDTLEIKLNGKVTAFHVAGYSEDPYFSVILNINVYYCYISDEMFEKLLADYPGDVAENVMHMGHWDASALEDGKTTIDLENAVTDRYKTLIAPYLTEHPEYASYMALNWETMKGGATIVPMIVMGILLIFAVLILIITVVIISFSVRNFIQRNMKNTGILEAAGYTVKEIRGATTFEVGLVAGIGTALGLLLGVLGSGALGNVVSSLIGLTWNRPADILILAITAVFNFGLVLLVTALISRRYKKITVLDALRGGMTNNNFKKNRFSFEKTKLPIPGVLSLKETFGNPGRSIGLILIVCVLAICTSLGFGMRETFGASKEKMIEIFSFEMSDIAVYTKSDIGEALKGMEDVEHVVCFYGFEPTVSSGEKSETIYTYAYDDNANRQYLQLIEGRVPEHDNEVIITPGVATDLNVGVGDMITVSYGDYSADYIITGMEQKMERMGRLLSMNFDGAKKLIPVNNALVYYVDGKDGQNYDSLKEKLEGLRKDKYPDEEWTYADIDKITSESADGIIVAMRVVCVLLLVVTILVVIFVESLVIRSRVIREWKNMGVSRALGMTYREILAQIMVSNLPAVLTGAVLGAIVSKLSSSKIVTMMLSVFGYKKVHFSISFVWLVVTVLVIAVVAVGTAALSGRKAKKLEPARLITEE